LTADSEFGSKLPANCAEKLMTAQLADRKNCRVIARRSTCRYLTARAVHFAALTKNFSQIGDAQLNTILLEKNRLVAARWH
jgi:hypothetical protein